ncbi:hypothetical protein DOY81_010096, partial [Sarcophaga bullata]
MKFLQALLAVCGIASITALPTKSDSESTPQISSLYASKASQIIATNLLKSYNDIDGNQVHSPLGVTTMLAILAEATQGDTYDEFYKVLGYPKERASLRDSFRSILNKYQTTILSPDPSFQTWLYIYRNFSAREDFKRIVQDNYYVDVKDINSEDYTGFEPDASLELGETTNNSKDVIGFETLKRLKVDDDDGDDDVDVDARSIGGHTTVGGYTDTYGEEFIEKETSKFDRFVDDKHSNNNNSKNKNKTDKDFKVTTLANNAEELEEEEVKETKQPALELAEKLENLDEKPVADVTNNYNNNADDDVANVLDAKDQSKREDDLNLEENETVQENEKILKNFKEDNVAAAVEAAAEAEAAIEDASNADKLLIPIQEVLESNEPEKVTLPLEKLETVLDEASKEGSPPEIMLALESHVSSARSAFGGRSLFRRDDITSALSANSITGRDVGSKTKMLLFNGLYFRGQWATEFKEERQIDEFFFMTSEDAMKTPMMHAYDKFYVADMESLNAKIICLPYE